MSNGWCHKALLTPTSASCLGPLAESSPLFRQGEGALFLEERVLPSPRTRAYCPMHRSFCADCDICAMDPAPYPHAVLALRQMECSRTLFALEEQSAAVHILAALIPLVEKNELPNKPSRLVWGKERAALGRVGEEGTIGLLELPEEAPMMKKLATYVLNDMQLKLVPYCAELGMDWLDGSRCRYDYIGALDVEASLKKDHETLANVLREFKDRVSPEEFKGWRAAFEAYWVHYRSVFRTRYERKAPSRIDYEGVICVALDRASVAFWEVCRDVL